MSIEEPKPGVYTLPDGTKVEGNPPNDTSAKPTGTFIAPNGERGGNEGKGETKPPEK